jgi:DNA-binding MarR family transcriptional regulator
MTTRKPHATRKAILEELSRVGREHSDATVLFHATLASQLDLHPTDYKALSVLERLGAMSAGEIARHAGLATASVTNLVDRLERKGFVRRMADARDRRRVMVEPILERVTVSRRLFASTRRSLARLLERYSDRDLVVIADFLARNAEWLRAETTKLSSPTARDGSGA